MTHQDPNPTQTQVYFPFSYLSFTCGLCKNASADSFRPPETDYNKIAINSCLRFSMLYRIVFDNPILLIGLFDSAQYLLLVLTESLNSNIGSISMPSVMPHFFYLRFDLVKILICSPFILQSTSLKHERSRLHTISAHHCDPDSASNQKHFLAIIRMQQFDESKKG